MAFQILAFGASSSRASINKALVTHAAERLVAEFLPGAEVDVLDLNEFEMPLYSIDRERADGIPAQAQRFFDAIGGADALLISYAEHNGHYTAAYKNLFDWASRIQQQVFQDTPMVVMSASTGRGGAARTLRAAVDSAPHFGAEILGAVSIPRFRETFVPGEGLVDAALTAELGVALAALAKRLRAGA